MKVFNHLYWADRLSFAINYFRCCIVHKITKFRPRPIQSPFVSYNFQPSPDPLAAQPMAHGPAQPMANTAQYLTSHHPFWSPGEAHGYNVTPVAPGQFTSLPEAICYVTQALNAERPEGRVRRESAGQFVLRFRLQHQRVFFARSKEWMVIFQCIQGLLRSLYWLVTRGYVWGT